MHDLLPLCKLIQELAKNSFISQMYLHGSILFTNNLKSMVFGDNQSCLTIASTDVNGPRTKHLSIKFHHIWDQVLNNTIQVAKVHTNDNWADIFTKPLTHTKFEWLCLIITYGLVTPHRCSAGQQVFPPTWSGFPWSTTWPKSCTSSSHLTSSP